MGKEVLSYKEFEGSRFYYLDFGSEIHGRRSFRLWVSSRLVSLEKTGAWEVVPVMIFPVVGARIKRTQKGIFVLRPAHEHTTFNIYVPGGYRGSSKIEILEPTPEVELTYWMYRSPRGSLGVYQGKVVSIRGDRLKYRWYKTGRLYGESPQGITVVYADGKVEELDTLPDGIESVEELKELLD